MPADSKSQQRLFGMIHDFQKNGDLPDDKDLADKIKKIAKGISKKDAKDFASTKHDGLPEKVKKEDEEPDIEESFKLMDILHSVLRENSITYKKFPRGTKYYKVLKKFDLNINMFRSKIQNSPEYDEFNKEFRGYPYQASPGDEIQIIGKRGGQELIFYIAKEYKGLWGVRVNIMIDYLVREGYLEQITKSQFWSMKYANTVYLGV